jgi:GT2 family glycosyltransferase
LEQVDAPYYVLLNSDVEVEPNWLEPMMNLIRSNDKIAAVQPKILDYNNRIYFEYAGASGGFIDKHAYPFCRGRVSNVLEEDAGQYDSAMPIFWATGAALLIRAEDYNKIGGLDADFFAHMEEIDLCWRLQNTHREVWVCPEAKVYHMGGGTLASSSPRKTYLNFRNNLALITKNLPFVQWLRVFVMRLILDGIAGVRFLLQGEAKQTLAIVKAHWSFFFRLPYWWKKRKGTTPRRFESLHGTRNYSLIYRHFIKGVKYFSDLEA